MIVFYLKIVTKPKSTGSICIIIQTNSFKTLLKILRSVNFRKCFQSLTFIHSYVQYIHCKKKTGCRSRFKNYFGLFHWVIIIINKKKSPQRSRKGQWTPVCHSVAGLQDSSPSACGLSGIPNMWVLRFVSATSHATN